MPASNDAKSKKSSSLHKIPRLPTKTTCTALKRSGVFFSIFSRNSGFVDIHTFGDLKMNNGHIISLSIFLSRGILRHHIGRILPLFSPAICSIILLQKNLREFCTERNGKHPLQSLCAALFLVIHLHRLCGQGNLCLRVKRKIDKNCLVFFVFSGL